MSIISVILLTIVLLQWTWVLWFRRRFYWVYKKLPGPWGLPFIGIGLKVRNPETFLHNLDQLGKVYKTPFITWLGTKCLLYLNDPVNIETVLKSSACVNKADIYHFLAAAIGDGLFTSSTPRWNKHRRLLNPSFSRRNTQTYLPIFNDEGNELIQKLILSQGKSLEIYNILKTTILEIACQTTMGKKKNFENDGSAKILNSYTSLTDSVIRRMLSPWLHPDLIFRKSGLYKIQQKCVGNLINFVEKLLKNDNESSMKNRTTEASISTSEDKGYNEDEGYNKFRASSFIECVRQHIHGGQLTLEDVRDEANVIISAAFETTATALYFVCLCLALHPDQQDKLYNELMEIFPAQTHCKDSNVDDITLEHLELMTYTEMVINEAMRLFAPVPFVLRRASTDFNLADGTQVPQGTQIGIDIFNMQRSEKIWGSHARSFDPELHFGASNEQHPYAFIPFTKGLRMCIGIRYSMMLMKVAVAKIFRNFRVHTDARINDLKVKGTISLKLCQYPLCSFEQRVLSEK